VNLYRPPTPLAVQSQMCRSSRLSLLSCDPLLIAALVPTTRGRQAFGTAAPAGFGPPEGCVITRFRNGPLGDGREPMSASSPSPLVKTRFRRSEIERLMAAVKIVVCARASHRLNGHSKNEVYWRIVPHRLPAGVCFDIEFMNRLQELWSWLCRAVKESGWQSQRITLHTIDFWLLALAVRMARHEECHPPAGASRPNRSRWTRLLRKLSRLERKGRRGWRQSEEDAEFFEYFRARWKGFQLWIKTNYGCRCRYPPLTRWTVHQRQSVPRVIEVAKEALKKADFQAPDEEELRRLVRLAFREVRRGRWPYSVPELVKGGPRACRFLVRFIKERLQRAGRLVFLD
jgi:hypothetical protein